MSSLQAIQVQESYQRLLINLGFSEQKALEVVNSLSLIQLEMIQEICSPALHTRENPPQQIIHAE